MSLANIKTALKAIVDGISGIEAAKVHKYPIWTNKWSTIKANFVDSANRINGWMIEWQNANADWKDMAAYKHRREHFFIIWGYYSIVTADGTVATYEGIVEALMNALAHQDNQTLGGAARWVHPCELLENTPVMFGSFLAMRCKIRIRVSEIVTSA